MTCFFSQNEADPFLMVVLSKRLLATFLLGSPSLLCPRSQFSSLGASLVITNCPHHPFLGCGHLISIGQPSSFAPTFYHKHAILSCPHSNPLCQSFLGDPFLGLVVLVPFQLLPASFLGFLGCRLLLKSLDYASICTSFLPNAHNLFFSLYGPGSYFLYF